ncbi:gas vesicle protein GvpJ [Actinorugispora endophytica]|uniref:Gas vesicle protein A n=1 Tax=Actinorugispora endophytica TaxID=1605990 RepID=A0A4R6V4N9_9ACTN|nr:gas vesicle protein GvpA/GvpJ/GvpM family [Actinorugispora endophytica]
MSRAGTLYDVLDLILDKGIVIDVFARVSLIGIEILTVDVRIVVASVDTYLRFAEMTNRLDLTHNSKAQTLPEMIGDITEKGAQGKGRGALSGAAEAVGDIVRPKGSRKEDDGDEEEAKPRQRARSASDEEKAKPRVRARRPRPDDEDAR